MKLGGVTMALLSLSMPAWSAKCQDTDADRLCDPVETNTGFFVSALNTGSNPFVADSDGDAINDGDEVLGPSNGLSFSGLNMDPNIRQILVEIDWTYDPSIGESPSTHDPSVDPEFIYSASFAFYQLPAFDRNGIHEGVKLAAPTHSYGNNAIPWVGPLSFQDIATLKAQNMDPRKLGYYHYMIITGNVQGNFAGMAELLGDDLMVIDYRTAYPGFSRALNNYLMGLGIAHEIGHNLGLHHGGGDSCNRKPNYLSLMNYTYNTGFVGAGCYVDQYVGTNPAVENPRGLFSLGGMPDLNEASLDETSGVCPGSMNWRDFNVNFRRESVPYAMKITTDCGTSYSVLRDFNDYQLMNFGGILEVNRDATIVLP